MLLQLSTILLSKIPCFPDLVMVNISSYFCFVCVYFFFVGSYIASFVMAATKTAGIRYAPDDPSLPKPWRGLVDGKTGYIYFWNPETNVTQYQKPGASQIKPDAPDKCLSESISSSVQVQQSSQVPNQEIANNFDDDKNRRGSDGIAKIDSCGKSYQVFNWHVYCFRFVPVVFFVIGCDNVILKSY